MVIARFLLNNRMKKILIAATAVGATIAGLILYNRRRNSASGQVERAAKDAYNTMNNGLGKIERNTMHSMG
jgi:hypothetical protein